MADRTVVITAVLVGLGALLAPAVPWPVGAGLVVLAVCLRRPPLLAVALALLVAGRAHQQVAALAAPLPDRVEGIGELADDPVDQLFGMQVVVRIDGRRYLAQVPFDHAAALRSAGTGDHVVVSGRPAPLEGAPAGWVRSRHLAGRLSVTSLERGPPAAPWFAAANAVRRTFAAGSRSFDDELRPLYLGMVIGDDRELSELRQFRFRAAGLSHLTAVSGQNVAFVIAVAAPLLVRLGRRSRAVVTLGILVAVVLVTRADPSVLRAGTMAGLAVVAISTGRVAPALRLLALTVTVLLAVDPMMVHSLGFRLSVAATTGLVLLTRPLGAHLPGPVWLRLPLAVTLAAQLATAPLLVGLNGGLSPAALVANLLAVPAAGAVMMLGVTVGMLSGLLAEPIAAVLQLPVRGLVGWIDVVARVASEAPVAMLDPIRLVIVLAVVLGGVAAGRWLDGRPKQVVWGVGAAVIVGVGWPPAPSAGVSNPADGVSVTAGACGGVVVELSGGADDAAALSALHRVGVRRVDVLVVGSGRSTQRAAAAVAEQWPVRRRVELVDDAEGQWRVGGVTVAVHAGTATIEASQAACRLTP